MKFLAVTRRVYLGDIYLSLMRDGHEVRVFADPLPNIPAFGGIIPLVGSWRDQLEWVGRDGVVFFEGVGTGKVQDALRARGFRVVGGSELGDRLEQDRAYGQSVLAELGLPIAWSKGFANPAEALEWLTAYPDMYVLKFDDNAYTTFVGDHPTGADVAFVLRRRADAGGVLLMEKLRGVEVGIGAYFDGRKFLMPACIDYEHKRFFPGDLGEMTGEMGTLASYDGAEHLFQATLGRVAPLLAGTGHVGYVNLNLIVDERGPFPLEFTCRIGNPGYAVLAAMQVDGWGDLFSRIVAGDADGFRTRPGYSVAIVLTVPPFPATWDDDPDMDIPTFYVTEPEVSELGNYHWVDMRRDEAGQLLCLRRSGHIMIVTGIGLDVATAQAAARRRAENVVAPELRWRADIGERYVTGERETLRRLGWL